MNVIIVDDEELARKRLDRLIRKARPDADLLLFDSAMEAYEYIKRNPCDAAVLDIAGMDMDGIETARKMMEIHPYLNIIFTTGYGQYALDAFALNASSYLVKPIRYEDIVRAFSTLRFQPVKKTKFYAKCFGNFEVFYEGEPVRFKRVKTKEMLAYLIDRRGSGCSSNEIVCILWEDEGHASYYKQVRKDLIDTFEALGIGELVKKTSGGLSIAYESFDSDLKEYLETGKSETYLGEYMSQYSWAEKTNAWLANKNSIEESS